MLATIAAELALAAYVVWRYHLNTLARLVVAALIGLATFQVAEYFVCTGTNAGAWSRLGFVAITTLPPLGLHILHQLAGKPAGRLMAAAYVSMVGFMAFFMLWPSAFTGQECTGNYVIFQIGYLAGGAYATFYYGWLLIALGLGVRWRKQLLAKGKQVADRHAQAIQGLILGYLVFLVPTGIANTISPETRRGIPSIMCGFAVLFAFMLTLYVLPRAGKIRSRVAGTLDKLR